MKRDHIEIRRLVARLKIEFGFRGPLHFTDFSNLSSIYNHDGIYSRNYCLSNSVKFVDVADRSVICNTRIDVQDCVRFYYKEKTVTLYKNEGIKEDGLPPHIPLPVYLLFDEEIIYLDYTIFSDGNAGSQYTRYGSTMEFFRDSMDWDTFFIEGQFLLMMDQKNVVLLEGDRRNYYPKNRCR